MLDRRSVLKIGAASVASAFVGASTPVLGWAHTVRPGFLGVGVFSQQHQEGLAFAEELRARRVAIFGARHDIAQLWYRDGLSDGTPIAGFTDRATLFCLEELARSAGMQVLYRVDHLIDEQGNAEHNAVGPASVLEAARKLAPKSGFGREMAVLASQFDFKEPRNTDALKRTGPFAPRNKVALVSWVMA